MKAFILCSICLIAVSGDTQLQTCGGKYRTINGFCNNKNHRTWGNANTAQRRFMNGAKPMVDYVDDFSIPRGGINPRTLPSPGEVSNVVANASRGGKDQKDPKRSAQSFSQGQIIAHDVIATTIPGGIDCCDDKNPESSDPDVCFNFTKQFEPDKPEKCQNFVRASRAPYSQNSQHREQINEVTSFLDASFLYGSSITRLNMVRNDNSFLMRLSKDDGLPFKPKRFADHCVKEVKADRCPFAGDARVSETPNLQLNHLIWIKEHNRIANILHELNNHWNNTIVFQETRRIIIAMWQHIVYNEYLPNVIKNKLMNDYELKSKKSGYKNVYNSTIDPSIRNSFGSAAWRFGHSQVVSEQSLLAADCSSRTVNNITDHFHNPHLLQVDGSTNVEAFSRWLTYTQSMDIDSFFVDGLRQNLFKNSDPPGDLFARNIQRARDHGVPGYNEWRRFCGLRSKNKFKQINNRFGNELKELYNTPDDVDLLVGGLLESNGGFVGATFGCIIAKQFQLLKQGDRFWYETDDEEVRFKQDQLQSIKDKTVLSKIFCRHTKLDIIQKNIFKPGNNSKRVQCDSLPEIDLNLWKEEI